MSKRPAQPDSTADEEFVPDVEPRGWGQSVVHHPLFGVHPRRTVAAVATIVGLAALNLASLYVSGAGPGERVQSLGPAFDSFTAFVIVVSLLVVAVGPLAYACWNGGPALSFVFALVPWLVGETLAFRWVLDVDLAVSLTTGVAGAALALVVGEIRRTGSMRPWRARSPPTPVALFVGCATVGSFALVGRFLASAPGGQTDAYLPFAVYWVVTLAVAGAYVASWANRRRSR
ncbi:hypothetical protein [Halovivax gelatinilyticus]|uniref:hypothetical protein n=1 Tax=Halovivax gelatinilyticus TaxID=2961597 RepID=UPI0020CA3DBA|nr:hypothetical protein [Halovivax gelatinilyticus]